MCSIWVKTESKKGFGSALLMNQLITIATPAQAGCRNPLCHAAESPQSVNVTLSKQTSAVMCVDDLDLLQLSGLFSVMYDID